MSTSHLTHSAVRDMGLLTLARAKAVGQGIRQMFRRLVYGEWSCPHEDLEIDAIGDIYCKRCNKDLMD
jgi:hypothetical protein